jgi:hypothetical protein
MYQSRPKHGIIDVGEVYSNSGKFSAGEHLGAFLWAMSTSIFPLRTFYCTSTHFLHGSNYATLHLGLLDICRMGFVHILVFSVQGLGEELF